jgi:hypothetical protein
MASKPRNRLGLLLVRPWPCRVVPLPASSRDATIRRCDHPRKRSSNRLIASINPSLPISWLQKNFQPTNGQLAIHYPNLIGFRRQFCRLPQIFELPLSSTEMVVDAQARCDDLPVASDDCDLDIVMISRLMTVPDIQCPSTGNAPWCVCASQLLNQLSN